MAAPIKEVGEGFVTSVMHITRPAFHCIFSLIHSANPFLTIELDKNNTALLVDLFVRIRDLEEPFATEVFARSPACKRSFCNIFRQTACYMITQLRRHWR